MLTVLEPAPNGENFQAYWLCRCECGNEKVIRGSSFIGGGTKSCGCLVNGPHITSKPKDRTGQRFGKLVAVRNLGKQRGEPGMWWLCRCDCGKEIEVRGGSLQSGYTKSCGNHKLETAHRTHGMSHTTEWHIWSGMKSRCNNPNDDRYPDYGGRGIRVCPEWSSSFEAFYADMGPRPSKGHSLDRIDVDGHYEKSNARWATVAEQHANKRSRLPIHEMRKQADQLVAIRAALAAVDPNHPLLTD